MKSAKKIKGQNKESHMKKGVQWSALTWLIIGVLFLIVVLLVVMLSSGRLTHVVDVVRALLRFGG